MPTSCCQTQHRQIQTWTATGVRAHPHIAATDSTPPDKRGQRGVQAHPHIAATNSSPPRSKRGQQRGCECTHSSLPQTQHRQINVHSDGSVSAPTRRCHKLVTPQIQVWTAMGVRVHPLITATDSTLPEKHAQRQECEHTHTSLPQTRHPQIQSWTATEVRVHPHIAATDSTPTEKRGQRRECERTHTSLPLPIIPTHEGSA